MFVMRPSYGSKDTLRQVIASQTAEYLSQGNEIHIIPPGETAEEFIPKRTRKQQVEWCRKKLKVNRG